MPEQNSPLDIRPHHGLCAGFFRGMGYDAAFAENMKAVLERLNGEDEYVRLTVGADAICARCPHNRDGVCDSTQKVERYDRAVLEKCGLQAGDVLAWRDFSEKVREKITVPGRLSEVCGDCAWYDFCCDIGRSENPSPQK